MMIALQIPNEMSPLPQPHWDADRPCQLWLCDCERCPAEGRTLGYGSQWANSDHRWASGTAPSPAAWALHGSSGLVSWLHARVSFSAHEEKQKLETDAMYRLEHGSNDQSKLQRVLPTLQNIQEAQSAWKDDFALNSLLRRKFRVSGLFFFFLQYSFITLDKSVCDEVAGTSKILYGGSSNHGRWEVSSRTQDRCLYFCNIVIMVFICWWCRSVFQSCHFWKVGGPCWWLLPECTMSNVNYGMHIVIFCSLHTRSVGLELDWIHLILEYVF